MTIQSVIPGEQHKGVAPHQPPLTVLQDILYKNSLKVTKYIKYKKKRIKNIRFLQLYTAMYRKLNDKQKTAYPQRVQYLDGSYRLSLLLKLITPSTSNPFTWPVIPNRR